MLDLRNKTAVVTGGAKGIGAATAKLLREAGARVEVLDIETGCDVTNESSAGSGPSTSWSITPAARSGKAPSR